MAPPNFVPVTVSPRRKAFVKSELLMSAFTMVGQETQLWVLTVPMNLLPLKDARSQLPVALEKLALAKTLLLSIADSNMAPLKSAPVACVLDI